MPDLTGSHLIARAIEQQIVTDIFTIVGDHTLPSMDVLDQRDTAAAQLPLPPPRSVGEGCRDACNLGGSRLLRLAPTESHW